MTELEAIQHSHDALEVVAGKLDYVCHLAEAARAQEPDGPLVELASELGFFADSISTARAWTQRTLRELQVEAGADEDRIVPPPPESPEMLMTLSDISRLTQLASREERDSGLRLRLRHFARAGAQWAVDTPPEDHQ